MRLICKNQVRGVESDKNNRQRRIYASIPVKVGARAAVGSGGEARQAQLVIPRWNAR